MADLYSKASIILTANAYSSSKIYAIKPTGSSGDQTCTRSSSGSRVNSSGLIELVNNNIPRLTYSGSSCPQFLFEPQRINLLAASNDLTNGTYWSTGNNGSATASQAISPDGTNNGYRVNLSTTADSFIANSTSPITNNTTYTISGFFKNISLSAGQTFVMRINNYGGGGAGGDMLAIATIDLGATTPAVAASLTGTAVTGYVANSATSSIENYGNGWYRITLKFTTGTNAATAGCGYQFIQPSSNAARSFYAYGAQFEAGRYPTSYIPTTTAAVTRIADNSGGNGFVNGFPLSSSIGQSEGTIYYEFTPAQTMIGAGGRILTALAPNTNAVSGSVGIILNGNDLFQFSIYSASSATIVNTVISSFPSPVTASRSYKIAFAYSSSNSKAYINGSQVLSSAATWPLNGITGSQGPMNNIWLTNDSYFTPDNQKEFKTVAIYKTRLTDAELIALTT
jgi:hypothetical protein